MGKAEEALRRRRLGLETKAQPVIEVTCPAEGGKAESSPVMETASEEHPAS